MSSPISPITGPLGSAQLSSPALSGAEDLTTLLCELGSDSAGPTIAAGRGGPPPEVLEQMAGAYKLWGRLRRRGLEVRFSLEQEGQPVIELHDEKHGTVRQLTMDEAMALAVGEVAE